MDSLLPLLAGAGWSFPCLFQAGSVWSVLHETLLEPERQLGIAAQTFCYEVYGEQLGTNFLPWAFPSNFWFITEPMTGNVVSIEHKLPISHLLGDQVTDHC